MGEQADQSGRRHRHGHRCQRGPGHVRDRVSPAGACRHVDGIARRRTDRRRGGPRRRRAVGRRLERPGIEPLDEENATQIIVDGAPIPQSGIAPTPPAIAPASRSANPARIPTAAT